MGFFAVSNLGSQTPFEIEACHISFWVLAKPWYQLFRYNFCFDVGLRIKSQEPLRRIRIVLPFDSDNAKTSDLSGMVLDPDFSPLIFGKPVSVNDGYVTYDGPLGGSDKISDRVIAVSSKNSAAEPTLTSSPGFSVWTIELEEPTQVDELTYVRFRIPARNPWRIWASKGWGLAKRGIVVDFRISDIRESLLLGHGKSEAAHLVPIKQLFLFLVVPSYFVPNHFSPALHYSRLLEPKVWKSYLASSSSYTEETKFSIHQWRHTKGPEISVENPYRAYMDLSREFGKEVFFYYGTAIVFAPLFIHLVETFARYLWTAVLG
jgi:hypothetical protein